MISEDEYLERIVAGIHAVTTEKAEVIWNVQLNGRQFDVVVRFRQGTLTYLVLVEVKNRTRRTSAEDLDAFVNKSRDQLASKAVFVTAAGFQSGAIEVARRHGIELFTVRFDDEDVSLAKQATHVSLALRPPVAGEAPRLELGVRQLVANVVGVKLTYQDGSTAEVPDEQSQMNYYLSKSRLSDGRILPELLAPEATIGLQLDERRTKAVRLRPIQRIDPPDDYFFPPGKLKSVDFEMVGAMGRQMTGNVLIDPGSFTSPVVYTNAITGEELRFTLDQLPLSFASPEIGSFYEQEHPLRYYYCEAIEGDLVTWVLVESFQAGQFIQARFTQQVQYAKHFAPVGSRTVLARLKRRLKHFNGLP